MSRNMLTMTIQINAPADMTIGIKEDIISHVERYGDARVISVEQRPQAQMEQMTIGGDRHNRGRASPLRR